MNITKRIINFMLLTVVFLSAPVLTLAQEYDVSSEPGINSGNNGFHLKGSVGVGKLFWGYISHGSGSGDLGTGEAANINIGAMYNYSFLGLEFNMLAGNISNLKWKDTDNVTKNEYTYESNGTGQYTVFDLKIGARLFTEPADMGYTFFYLGKRYWNSERKEKTRKINGVTVYSAEEKREAKGDGTIYGYRDFSTIPIDGVSSLVIQSGLFFGKAPVSEMSTNGINQTYPVNESLSIGAEIGAGIAFEKTGLSVIGGVRGEINATTFIDKAAPVDEESVFGFGNAVVFVEAGLMF